MTPSDQFASNRRHFFRAGVASLFAGAAPAAESRPNVLGPAPGYSPHTGTLVSEMAWMRSKVLATVDGMTRSGLDHLLDKNANTAGALLLHLAATERLYQINTFDNVGADAVEKTSAFRDWTVAMNLGDPARREIKGHDLDYYLKALADVRARTLAELRRRDDKWLLAVDEKWPWGPTNNLCKWFHVVEHESHHNGQIAFIRGRLPAA